MRKILHVLSVGSADASMFVRDALLQRQKCCLASATCLRELFSISNEEQIEIAVLHQNLSPTEFREAAGHIRRKWPTAKILVVCCMTADFLEDPLYDERATPGLSQQSLLSRIERLAEVSASVTTAAKNWHGITVRGRTGNLT